MNQIKGFREIESSLRKIDKILDQLGKRREWVLKNSRGILSLTKKAIVFTQYEEVEKAKKLIRKAEGKLKKLNERAKPDLLKYLTPVEAEYVEAVCFMSIVGELKIPRFEELSVQPAAYLLGLLDCIGEIRRKILDELRKENIEKARSLFRVMEAIYTRIMPMTIYDNLVQGLRHKVDIARNLVEDTRSLLTEEIGRRELMKKLSDLERQWKKKVLSSNKVREL